MSHKLYNPKSHAPAVYIPCWLIQVPIKLLSHAAKITYGRLSQWANESGIVYRSVPQLSQELGSSIGSVEKYLKELKDCGLIGIFHPQAGGVNHFEFYDHPWMNETINEHLSYKQDKTYPPPDLTAPPSRSYGTPPPDLTDINIKEIKVNKKDKTPLTPKGECVRFEEFWNLYPVKASKKTCLEKWKKLHLDTVADYILEKLSDQVQKDDAWKRGYCPNPLTYINQHKWDDAIKQPAKTSGNAFSNFMQSQNKKGVVIDEHGNDYDPFSDPHCDY